jgi:type IV secretion system protein TrbL
VLPTLHADVPALSGLPIIPTVGCADPVTAAVCQAAGSVGSTLVGDGASTVLSSVAQWVVDGAAWLLGQIGAVMTATTSVDLGASWFQAHYAVMAALAGIVILPLVLLAAIQAVVRQRADQLVRSVLVHLPLALLLTGAATELVQLSLAATDALSGAVAAGSGTDLTRTLTGLADSLTTSAAASAAGSTTPSLIVLLGALVVVVGALMLWLELLVREAAVYVAVLFLPLALASLVWPAISHWCRRLAETLTALILSKFVIVAVLSLAAGALASGTAAPPGGGPGAGFAGVLAGGALLLLAAMTPFTLLRLVPAVEAGAVHQLEGARHRVQAAVTAGPRTAAAVALRFGGGFGTDAAGSLIGTGLGAAFEEPGADSGAGTGGAAATGPGPGRGDAPSGGRSAGRGGPQGDAPPGGDGVGAPPAGAPRWRGNPESAAIVEAVLTGAVPVSAPARGPMPVLAPSGAAGRDRDDAPAALPAPRGASTGTHRIAHDALGPVIRWDPPPPTGPDGSPGGDG